MFRATNSFQKNLKKVFFLAACATLTLPATARQVVINSALVDTLEWRVPDAAPLVRDRSKLAVNVRPNAMVAPTLQLNGREPELQVDTPVNSNQTFSAVSLEPSAPPTVFAIYDLYSGTLRVDLFKVEKLGRTAQFLQAQFAPMHGSQWKAQGTFKDTSGIAVDPFIQWQNPWNMPDRTGTVPNAPGNLFYNISPAGAQVVVSMAMASVKAPTAILGISNVKTTRADMQMPLTPLAKSVTPPLYDYQSTQYIEWFSILPASLSSGGKTVWVCASGALPASCPDSLKMPSLTKIQKMHPNHRLLGTQSTLGGDCSQGAFSPCTNTMSMPAGTVKAWSTAGPNQLITDGSQTATYPVLQAYLAMGARGRVGQIAIAPPSKQTFDGLSMGKTKLAGLSNDSENAANSLDIGYGAPASAPQGLVVTGSSALDLSVQNSQAGVAMNTALEGPPQTASLYAIPYFLQESVMPDEFDTLKQTRKMLGTFNTQNPTSDVTPGAYRSSYGQALNPTLDPSTVQSQTQTSSSKGLAVRQKQAVQ